MKRTHQSTVVGASPDLDGTADGWTTVEEVIHVVSPSQNYLFVTKCIFLVLTTGVSHRPHSPQPTGH